MYRWSKLDLEVGKEEWRRGRAASQLPLPSSISIDRHVLFLSSSLDSASLTMLTFSAPSSCFSRAKRRPAPPSNIAGPSSSRTVTSSNGSSNNGIPPASYQIETAHLPNGETREYVVVGDDSPTPPPKKRTTRAVVAAASGAGSTSSNVASGSSSAATRKRKVEEQTVGGSSAKRPANYDSKVSFSSPHLVFDSPLFSSVLVLALADFFLVSISSPYPSFSPSPLDLEPRQVALTPFLHHHHHKVLLLATTPRDTTSSTRTTLSTAAVRLFSLVSSFIRCTRIPR